MKGISKVLLRLTAFALILLVLLFGASVLFQPKSNSKDAGMLDSTANGILGEPQNTIDVLIIGDSEAYSAFVPLKIWNDYGYTPYVCATSAQILCYSYEFLQKTFEKQQPRVVILETNAIYRAFSDSDILSQKLAEVMSVFRYHNRWKTLSLRDWSFGVDLSNTEINKGYVYSNAVGSVDAKGYMKPSKNHEGIPKKNKAYVEKINKLCEQNGAKLVLVSSPSVKNWNMRRHNAVTELSKKIGCDYIDMNAMRKEIPIDWKTDTKDKGDHLNYTGALKASAYLGKYFDSLKIFRDKRNDPEFKQWNNAVKEFSESTGKSL